MHAGTGEGAPTAFTKVDQEKIRYVRGGRHGCCSATRILEARLQFELVLRTNKLANAVLLQRRCLSCPQGLNHRKGAGDDSIPSRKSLSGLGSGLGLAGGCQCKQHLDWGWGWGSGLGLAGGCLCKQHQDWGWDPSRLLLPPTETHVCRCVNSHHLVSHHMECGN